MLLSSSRIENIAISRDHTYAILPDEFFIIMILLVYSYHVSDVDH